MPRATRRRAAALACAVGLLALLLVVPACGGDEEEGEVRTDAELLAALYEVEEEERGVIGEELGRRAASDPSLVDRLLERMRNDDPDPVMHTFRIELEGVDAKPGTLEHRQAMREGTAVMARRLRAHGHSPGTFDHRANEGWIQLRIPKPFFGPEVAIEQRVRFWRDHARMLVRHMTVRGSAELLVEVEPPAEDLERPSLWTGTREAFDAFVDREGKRVEKALEEHLLYVPPPGEFLLCRLRPEKPGGPYRLAVVYRAPGAANRFGRKDMEIEPVTMTETEQIGLDFKVVPDRQADMERWTTANRGRRLALVVNGDIQVLTRILGPARDSLTILFGGQSDPHARSDLEGVMRVLASPEHEHGLRVAHVTDVEPHVLTPAMAALVGCGAAAEARLGEAMREGGTFALRVRRVLEHIGRRRTSGGERFVPGADQPR